MATDTQLSDLDLADLELRAQAVETEETAKQNALRLAQDLGRDVALNDHNPRASRYASSFDGRYRSVIYTHASAIDIVTHQHFYGWDKLVAKHNHRNPKHKLSQAQFREISYELARRGVLEIRKRKRVDTVPLDAPYPLGWNRQTSSLYTVHVGLAIVRGQLVHHDWNAPVTQAARPPRLSCQQCGAEFDSPRSSARYCSESCKQRAKRSRDTLTSSGPGSGGSSGTAPISSLTPKEDSSASSRADDASSVIGEMVERFTSRWPELNRLTVRRCLREAQTGDDGAVADAIDAWLAGWLPSFSRDPKLVGPGFVIAVLRDALADLVAEAEHEIPRHDLVCQNINVTAEEFDFDAESGNWTFIGYQYEWEAFTAEFDAAPTADAQDEVLERHCFARKVNTDKKTSTGRSET